MTRNTITRFATTAVVTGFASLALAGPAAAVEAPNPEGDVVSWPEPAAGPTTDDPWFEIAVGALGGLALAGAGMAAAAGVRHRQAVHPA